MDNVELAIKLKCVWEDASDNKLQCWKEVALWVEKNFTPNDEIDKPWLELYQDYNTVWAALKTTGRKPEQMCAEISRLTQFERDVKEALGI